MEDIFRYGPLNNTIGNYGIRKRRSIPIPPEVRTYATWNPADIGGGVSLSNGNLTFANPGAWSAGRSTILKSSGKWYWEYTIDGVGGGNVLEGVGTSSATLSNYLGSDAFGWGLYNADTKFNNNSGVAYGGATLLTGDVISVLLDATNGTLEFYRNGTTLGVAYASGVTGNIFAMISTTASTVTANFGATPFAYSVPSGYNAGLYDTVDLTAGLVAHYPLATNSLDISGNGYDGTDTNVTYSSGSAVFNGSNASISKTSFPVITPFTTSLWLNSNTASGLGNYKYAISLSENNPAGYFNMSFVFDHGDGSFAQALVIHNSSGYQKLKIQGFTLQASTDYNIVMSYAGGSGGAMNIYVNGVLNNTMNLTGAIGSVNPTLCIGADNFSGTPGNFFAGNIKKARIYNRVLNAGEIAALYAEV